MFVLFSARKGSEAICVDVIDICPIVDQAVDGVEMASE